MRTFLSAAALTLCVADAHADVPGLQIAEVFMPHHDAAARVAIWYPGASEEGPVLYADNPVFKGVTAHMDVPVSPGQHPVVLFSHGMGGTDRAQAWLGAELAKRGAITIMLNHPNTTWGDFDLAEGVEHWTRAQDMSAAMDAVLDMEEFSQGIDLSRVMAAGFSFGGWTALSLGGVRGRHAGVVDACTARPEMESCDMLLSDKVNMQDIEPAIWNASYADPRITHVVAIDPGFVWGLTLSDTADLLEDAVLVGFGGADDRMLATDFDRSGLAALMGDRRIERFDPAYHFSAMPICKPAGEAILVEENDDPVCTDPAGADRAAIHDRIVGVLAGELGL